MIDDIIDLCCKKQWCQATELFDKYPKQCHELWTHYDTLFNYQINKCGMCRRMKQAIVKQRWSDAESYPLINRLTCVNKDCSFYLIFNSDIDCFLANKKNGKSNEKYNYSQ